MTNTPEKPIGIISRIIHAEMPLGTISTGKINDISRKIAKAMGDASTRKDEALGDDSPPVGETPPTKQHFSNCSIYDDSGTKIPNGECDCGGARDDPQGTPEWVKRWEEQPQDRSEISVVDLRQQIRQAIFTYGSDTLSEEDTDAKADGVMITLNDCGYLRQPMPVSIEVCAVAASRWANGVDRHDPYWNYLSEQQRNAYRDQSEAILDAAGVKYE